MKRRNDGVKGPYQYNEKRLCHDDDRDIANLRVPHHDSRHRPSFPPFRKPEEILSFSVDSNRIAHLGNAQRKVYVPPTEVETRKGLHYDLNKGLTSLIMKNDEPEFINKLLVCLDHGKLVGTADVVCWRGLLSKIVCTPYEANSRFAEGWIISAQKINGCIYMCEYKTEKAKERIENTTARDKKMAFWGHKFETYVTAEDGCKPDTESAVNLNEEFGIVVRSKIGNNHLMFGGEVDCCKSEDHTKYIELKTSIEMTHPRQQISFKRFKLLKWWVQSFLIGIDDIICGFRDDDGIVSRLQSYKVKDIPRMVRKDDYWDPNICFDFLKCFIDFVKENVRKEHTPYVFQCPAQSRYVTLTSAIDEREYSFIPQWFIDKYGCK